MRITTKIIIDIENSEILDHQYYDHIGQIEFCCGATDAQNEIQQAQINNMNILTQQAQEEFGQASKVFNDLFNAMAPIVAAGPNQLGFSPAELANTYSNITDATGQAYKNASQSVRQQEAAAGGSDFIPSGANEQINATVAAGAANQESSLDTQALAADYATGRQNYFTAAGDLAAATGTFNPATGAANAGTGAGQAASTTANEIATQDNSWVQAVSGAIGGVAGGIATGGMSNLGKGLGFFGQNAPAPGGGASA